MRLSHIGWNLAGLSAPLLVAALTVPLLIDKLGAERFGLLALAWGLIGYAGALDLGIGRATTQYVAKLRGGGDSSRMLIPTVLTTAIRITSLAGGIGFLIITSAGILGVSEYIKLTEVNATEVQTSIFFLALALPLQAVSATYRGINEAYLNFKAINIVRALLGMTNFGIPFFVAMFSTKMYWLIASLVLSRAIALFAFKVLAERCISDLLPLHKSMFSMDVAKYLFKFGGWFTLSSILNPAVGVADRFIIASIISAAAVSSYVIPYEFVVQSLIIVGSITTVMFPYFSQLRISEPKRVYRMFFRVLGGSVAVMTCIAIAYNLLGGTVLSHWLGEKSNADLLGVLGILSYGLVPYTVGTICIGLLHSSGKTELTAKINIIEFPLFATIVYLLTDQFMLMGAAYAWVLRVFIDACILFYFAVKYK